MDQYRLGAESHCLRLAHVVRAGIGTEHSQPPENGHVSHQIPGSVAHTTTQSDRWSRISSLSNWRWSRTMLEPESLAVFQPLNLEPAQFILGDISKLEKSSCLADEGTNIVDEELDASFDRDLSTRNFSVVALILALSVGTCSLMLGTRIILSGKVLLPSFLLGKYVNVGNVNYPFPAIKTTKHYFVGHRVFRMPQVAVLSASLALNVLLTILFDSMNYIQACTLRWALWQEGRLQYNSNPRLLISARSFAPNSWYMNIISSIALVIGYGAASTLTSSVHMVGLSDPRGRLITPAESQGWALDVNGWCLAGLGVALLLQGLVCSWCLARSRHVATWSSNPLNTARVCFINHSSGNLLQSNPRVPEKCQDKGGVLPSTSCSSTPIQAKWPRLQPSNGSFLAVPLRRQPAMKVLVPRSQTLTRTIWAIFTLVAIWTIIVAGISQRTGTCSAAHVRGATHTLDFMDVWQNYCQTITRTWKSAYTKRRDWLGLIIHSLIFGIISLGLHCAELLTEMTRDEAIWRKATTNGANQTLGSITQATLSWQSWLLFVFKCVIPWIFGYALDTTLSIIMSLLPILTTALLFLLLGLLTEFLVRHKPKGPQPATYGNIEALISFIDDWQEDKIFWGDKGAVTETIRKAGTSGQRLADLQMNCLYQGLRG